MLSRDPSSFARSEAMALDRASVVELSPGAANGQTSTQAAGLSRLLAGDSGRFHDRCGGLCPGLGQVIASVFLK